MPPFGWIRRALEGVEGAVESLENRDNIVRAVIAESERAERLVAEEITQVRAQVGSTERALARTKSNAASWREKAARIGKHQPKEALTFLHRKKRANERANELSQWLKETHEREQALLHQAEQLRHRTRALEQKHRMLSSRERTAEAYAELSRQNDQTTQTEKLIDRWQTKLERQELSSFGHGVETERVEELEIGSFEEEELIRELEDLLEEEND